MFNFFCPHLYTNTRFSEGEGFDSAMAFSDCLELFEELWRIWYEHEVLTPVLGTPLAELDYDEIFQTLSKDRQEEILEKKKYFISRCEDAVKNVCPLCADPSHL